MQYANHSTQALYRKLRKEGATAPSAVETIKLLLNESPETPEPPMAHWEVSSGPEKAKLPYYHGNRRF